MRYPYRLSSIPQCGKRHFHQASAIVLKKRKLNGNDVEKYREVLAFYQLHFMEKKCSEVLEYCEIFK